MEIPPLKCLLKPSSDPNGQRTVELLLKANRLLENLEEEKLCYRDNLRRDLAKKLWSLKKRAYTSGYKAGFALGEENALKLFSQAHIEFEQLIIKAKEECVSLSISVAEEVVGATLKKSNLGIRSRITRALTQIKDHTKFEIQVNQDEWSALTNDTPPQELPFEISPNDSVARGSVRFVSKFGLGEIEISAEHFLSEIKEQLTEKLLTGQL